MATKYTKAEVQYSDKGHEDSHCSICRHWLGRRNCDIVEGTVAPGGWCEHFKLRKREHGQK